MGFIFKVCITVRENICNFRVLDGASCLVARADRCLGWDAWGQLLIRATRRPTKDPLDLVGSMYLQNGLSVCA